MPQNSKKASNVVARRSPLGLDQLHLMLTTLLRKKRAFEAAKDKLTPAHLATACVGLDIVWACAVDFYNRFSKLPNYDELFADVNSRLSEDPDYLTSSETETLDTFLYRAYRRKRAALDAAVALKFLSDFLEERLQAELRTKLESDEIAVDLPALLEEHVQQIRGVKAVETGSLLQPFPEEMLTAKALPRINKISTGCSFLDHYMNGGQVAGEVYGFCAPYGVGKTLLAVQLCVNRARWEQAYSTAGKPLPIVYLAVWEEEVASVQIRLLTYAGMVNKNTVEEGNLKKMSTRRRPSSYKQYERDLFADLFREGFKVPGERERVRAAMRLVNRNIRVIDFTGTNVALHEHAANMARGLKQVIEADQAANNYPGVSMVVCDHANAAAEVAIEYHGLDPDKRKRHLIGGFPRALKHHIAGPYACPVWVMHQLDTRANAKAAGVAPKVTDTAEAKNFFEYCNFGFMLGTKTLDELCVLTNGKTRRGEKRKDTVIRVNGAMGRVEETSGQYCLDNGSIVPTEEFSKYADAPDEEDDYEYLDNERREREKDIW